MIQKRPRTPGELKNQIFDYLQRGEPLEVALSSDFAYFATRASDALNYLQVPIAFSEDAKTSYNIIGGGAIT